MYIYMCVYIYIYMFLCGSPALDFTQPVDLATIPSCRSWKPSSGPRKWLRTPAWMHGREVRFVHYVEQEHLVNKSVRLS